MNQKTSLTYPMQFALLIGVMGISMIITSYLISYGGSLLLHVPPKQVTTAIAKPGNEDVARFLNTVASAFVFLFPAWFFAMKIADRPFYFLGFRKAAGAKQMMWLFFILITGMLFGGALGVLNEHIPLPAGLLIKAKKLEEEYKASTMVMANMKTITDYFLSILVLAMAPALFEEVLFRGGFQQIFIGWTKSKWAGIIITSALFSAFHFSFFGFLPRLALGIILGLTFFYSKNIWLNILLHFLNNAMVVTQLYLLQKQGKTIDKTMDENMPVWLGLAALLLLISFFRNFKKESERVLHQQAPQVYSSPEKL